ncbi:MAG: hypothetical protein WCJ67_11105 [Thermoleophilia bacterium]
MRATAWKILPALALIPLPIIASLVFFQIARSDDSLAIDFHNELDPEA